MFGLYPLVATTSMHLVHCLHLPATYTAPARWVVADQPYLTCLGSEHRLPALLAAVTGLAYVLGFPVVTWVYLWVHRVLWLRDASEGGEWLSEWRSSLSCPLPSPHPWRSYTGAGEARCMWWVPSP
jgi:hypothetical protein